MSPSKSAIILQIADFIIKITRGEDDIPLLIEKGYEAFILAQQNHFVGEDASVVVFPKIADVLLTQQELLFTAEQNGQPLWQIGRWSNLYRFIVFSPHQPGKIQQVALVDPSFKQWQVYMEPIRIADGTTGVCPLLYPMGPLILYYLTVTHDAVLIHACGVSDSGKGYVFIGSSGKGKTTMAKIIQQAGGIVINDDRLFIRKQQGRYVFHNTPMFYMDIPRSAHLNTLFVLQHGETNEARRLFGAEAVAALMTCCVQHNYDKRYIENHLRFLNALCDAVPVYKLKFVPNTTIVNLIRSGNFERFPI